ncbi:hypothetical protein GUJ93_ZPchr0011g28701 [Zizania palustris]|uniref:Uncharacterized protein n=1 Tax=Zizania palustris TaxID=103762 RepID=A0A8J5WDZ2_ZIZPA|nr:hypothetical protein GUJ93_ZPchr0011g28701 [Zizania palustris]
MHSLLGLRRLVLHSHGPWFGFVFVFVSVALKVSHDKNLAELLPSLFPPHTSLLPRAATGVDEYEHPPRAAVVRDAWRQVRGEEETTTRLLFAVVDGTGRYRLAHRAHRRRQAYVQQNVATVFVLLSNLVFLSAVVVAVVVLCQSRSSRRGGRLTQTITHFLKK